MLKRVWGARGKADLRLMRTIVSKLQGKLDEDVNQPSYIFTEPGVGFLVPRREGPAETAGEESQDRD